MTDVFPFSVERRKVADDIELLCFDIEDMHCAFSYLDNHIAAIFCGRKSDGDLQYAK